MALKFDPHADIDASPIKLPRPHSEHSFDASFEERGEEEGGGGEEEAAEAISTGPKKRNIQRAARIRDPKKPKKLVEAPEEIIDFETFRPRVDADARRWTAKLETVIRNLDIGNPTRVYERVEGMIRESHPDQAEFFHYFYTFVRNVEGLSNQKRGSFWVAETEGLTHLAKNVIEAATDRVGVVHIQDADYFPLTKNELAITIYYQLKQYKIRPTPPPRVSSTLPSPLSSSSAASSSSPLPPSSPSSSAASSSSSSYSREAAFLSIPEGERWRHQRPMPQGTNDFKRSLIPPEVFDSAASKGELEQELRDEQPVRKDYIERVKRVLEKDNEQVSDFMKRAKRSGGVVSRLYRGKRSGPKYEFSTVSDPAGREMASVYEENLEADPSFDYNLGELEATYERDKSYPTTRYPGAPIRLYDQRNLSYAGGVRSGGVNPPVLFDRHELLLTPWNFWYILHDQVITPMNRNGDGNYVIELQEDRENNHPWTIVDKGQYIVDLGHYFADFLWKFLQIRQLRGALVRKPSMLSVRKFLDNRAIERVVGEIRALDASSRHVEPWEDRVYSMLQVAVAPVFFTAFQAALGGTQLQFNLASPKFIKALQDIKFAELVAARISLQITRSRPTATGIQLSYASRCVAEQIDNTNLSLHGTKKISSRPSTASPFDSSSSSSSSVRRLTSPAILEIFS